MNLSNLTTLGGVVVYVSYSGERGLKDGIDMFTKQLDLSGEDQ